MARDEPWSLQLAMVRAVGTFLADPLDVPTVVVDYVAGQVGMADASVIKRYTEHRSAQFEHQAEITGPTVPDRKKCKGTPSRS